MSNIVQLADRRRAISQNNQIIKKLVDGEIVECVNLDSLTPAELSKYFSTNK
jgi:ABC-type transporter MlaC component